MERYPFDALPSGSLISELVDFSDYYQDPNEPFRNESWQFTRREMTRFIGGTPISLSFSQAPLDFAVVEETVEKGSGNLPQEEPLSSIDDIDDQGPEWDISPQVEPNQNLNQLEPIQYEDISQEEQPQGDDPSQERNFPVYTYLPQLRVWVRPMSALFSSQLPSSLDRYTNNTQTNLSASNEPAISNTSDRPVVETSTTEGTSTDVIDISSNNQQQLSQSPIPLPSPPTPPPPPPPSPQPPPTPPPPPPAISPQTMPLQQEEGSESAPKKNKKIPVPVLRIKPLAKIRQSCESRIPMYCDFPGCNKTLKYKNVKRHKATHSSLKPYKCDEPFCKWTFGRLCELNRHKTSKHSSSEKLYNCRYCRKHHTRKDNLVKHEKVCSIRKLQSKNKQSIAY